MCDMCDGQTFQESMAGVRDKVSRFGWAIQAVEGEVDEEGVHPAFAYTVGFTRHCLPEVVITGKTSSESGDLLNQLGRGIKRGLRLVPEIRMRIAGIDLFMLPVAHTEEVLITAHNLYPGRMITALQAVWADSEGKMPWEQEHPDDLTQPLVCELPERWFYCAEHQPPHQ